MRAFRNFFGVVAIGILGMPSLAQEAPGDYRAHLESLELPAIGAMVVRDGEVLLELYEGEALEGRVSSESKWHLGSNTKNMTATLIARLVENGTLSWDNTLDELLEAHGYEVPDSYADVTLLDLCTNRSWLPQNVTHRALWNRMWADRKMDPIEQRRLLTRWALTVEPESTERGDRYSNVGFAIAGHIAELSTGVAYEELMQREVFEPLGITSAGFGQPIGHAHPQGHNGDKPVGQGALSDNPSSIAPAGRVHMTLSDWTKYISAHATESDLLAPATWRVLHTPPMDDSDYAAGWAVRMLETGDEPVLWHNGSNTFWYAEGWALPEHDLVIVVATNTMSDAVLKVRETAVMLIETYGESPEPEGKR